MQKLQYLKTLEETFSQSCSNFLALFLARSTSIKKDVLMRQNLIRKIVKSGDNKLVFLYEITGGFFKNKKHKAVKSDERTKMNVEKREKTEK